VAPLVSIGDDWRIAKAPYYQPGKPVCNLPIRSLRPLVRPCWPVPRVPVLVKGFAFVR